ncbi:MAG: hypothetical protein ACI95X_002131 [Paraglaciecola sp.]|jgi:hypothetical protein
MGNKRHRWAFFASKSTEVSFDLSGALYRIYTQPKFESDFSLLISAAIDTSLAQTLVHFVSEDSCLYQLVAIRHIHEVKHQATNVGKTNMTVNIEDIPRLNDIFNRTPAIAIFDDEGNLAYLGPYSTGIGCFSGNNTFEPYLDSKANLRAMIPLEATGCYCNKLIVTYWAFYHNTNQVQIN